MFYMTADKVRIYVHKFISELGCPNKYNGSYFLRDGICWALENPDNGRCLKKNVYCEIAKKYRTGVDNVERNMRTLVDKWWDNERCGGLFKKRPTNGELFHTLITKISIEIEAV